MDKSKAYCIELERNVDIYEAREFYFSQSEPRSKLTFMCGDPRCRSISQALVVGANYWKLPNNTEDKVVSPYYRENPHYAHIANCSWISNGEKNHNKRTDLVKEHNARSSAATEDKGFVFKPAGYNKKLSENTKPNRNNSDDLLAKDGKKPTKSSSSEKTSRPETSKFMAVVAIKFLSLTLDQKKKTPFEIDGKQKGSFYEICRPVKQFRTYYQDSRIYYGRCTVVNLSNAFLIKMYGHVTVDECEYPAEISLSKKWLSENNNMLQDVLNNLSEGEVGWLFVYTKKPPEIKEVLGRSVARLIVENGAYLAVVPDSERTELSPDE